MGGAAGPAGGGHSIPMLANSAGGLGTRSSQRQGGPGPRPGPKVEGEGADGDERSASVIRGHVQLFCSKSPRAELLWGTLVYLCHSLLKPPL